MKEHLYDLAEQHYTQNRQTETDFLTPEEFSSLQPLLRSVDYADPHVFSEEWERKVIHFGSDAPDIAVLSIRPHGGANAGLRHPDYLGALIGTGIERRVIGDLIVQPDVCYAIVKKHIASFLANTLHEVGRSQVRIEILDALPDETMPHPISDEVIVSSLRLDRFVSTAFHLGRNAAQEAIEASQVAIDGVIEKRPHLLLKPGQRISMRHKGKVQFEQIRRETKSGSLILSVVRFQS